MCKCHSEQSEESHFEIWLHRTHVSQSILFRNDNRFSIKKTSLDNK